MKSSSCRRLLLSFTSKRSYFGDSRHGSSVMDPFIRRRPASPSRRSDNAAVDVSSPREISSYGGAGRHGLIPPPTWSVASLELDRSHPPVDDTVLRTLAKRSLIRLHDDGLSSLDVAALRRDVGNIMHMMRQVVLDSEVNDGTSGENDNDDDVETARRYYDAPRHCVVDAATPLRDGDDEIDDDGDDENSAVWDSFLAPQTQRVGAYSYFVIATQKKT